MYLRVQLKQKYAAKDTCAHSHICKGCYQHHRRKERVAWKLLAKIREKYKKQKGQFVTVEEFCEFTGIKEERVQKFLYS